MNRIDLLTIGQIADELKEPPARVSYVISKKRLKPVSRVGIVRLFAKEQLDIIKRGLYGIQIRGER